MWQDLAVFIEESTEGEPLIEVVRCTPFARTGRHLGLLSEGCMRVSNPSTGRQSRSVG